MTGKNPEALRTILAAAADCIRAANHQSLPREGAPGLEQPADVYDAIGNLTVLAGRLPQLFRQLSLWLGEQNAAGKVACDTGQDPGSCVADVRGLLDAAEECAGELRAILNRAHNASSGLNAAR